MRWKCIIVILGIFNSNLNSQVAINTDGSAPNSSAMLDIKSTAKGVLLPRLTSLQRKAIVNPSPGLLVFDLDKNSLYLFDGAGWQAMMFLPSSIIQPVPRTAIDEPLSRNFGTAVGISGDYAIVGADYDSTGTNYNQGAAYIFFRSGGSWVQQAKVIATDGATGDRFGYSVAIAGDYAIVGAPYKNSSQGAAYIFIRSGTTWTQQAKIVATDGAAFDLFGYSVSISGARVLVGSPEDNIGTYSNQGSAYVFFRVSSTWSQQAKLVASDGAAEDKFGNAVSISGNDLLVGAYQAEVGGTFNAGAAYLFYYNAIFGWLSGDKLVSVDAHQSSDRFGQAVAIEGNYAVISALGSPISGSARIFFFFRSGGIFTWQDYEFGSTTSSFGQSLALSGDYVIVGAPNDHWTEGYFDGTGSTYLYKRTLTNWNLVREINDTDNDLTRNTGHAVSISGINVIFSDPYKQKVYFANFED
jgi:hypothetical protein